MKGEAKWNPETGKGTYGSNIHHGEVKINSKFLNGGNSASGQNLAAKNGVDGAKRIMKKSA